MKSIITFTVSGNGDFPLDMLRYDSCFPLTTDDASNISRPRDERLSDTHRSVRLSIPAECNRNYPSEGRWSSFGWVVTDVEFDDLATEINVPIARKLVMGHREFLGGNNNSICMKDGHGTKDYHSEFGNVWLAALKDLGFTL